MDLILSVRATREEERRRKSGETHQRDDGITDLGKKTDGDGGEKEKRDWMEEIRKKEKNEMLTEKEIKERDGNPEEEEDEDEEVETDDEDDETECSECERNPSLLCQDEWRSVCRECAAAGRHRGHTVCPMREAVKDCKAKLRSSLKSLFESVKATANVSQTCSQADKFIPVQARQTKRQITEEFEKLHQFLREEEEARLAALREEEEERKRGLEERRDRLRKEMCSLWFAIKASERDCRSDDITFLQNYKNTVKRSWQSHKQPEKVCGPLIDVAKHVGNLRYTVWDKMRHIAPYTPVTLDPNTANSYLSLSPDLTGVKESEDDEGEKGGAFSPELPDTLERFACCGEMLASQGFSSGAHSWVVDVHDNNSWILGVATESVARKELVEACPENGLWALSMRRGEFEALESPAVPLSIPSSSLASTGIGHKHRSHTLRRLRVCLDYDGGRVSFRDADSDTHLYTFAYSFTSFLRGAERVYPYFSTSCELHPLRVVPERVRVEVWEPGVEEEEEDRREREEETETKTGEEIGERMKSREAVRRKEAERRRKKEKEI